VNLRHAAALALGGVVSDVKKAGCAPDVPGSGLQSLMCIGCSTQPAF